MTLLETINQSLGPLGFRTVTPSDKLVPLMAEIREFLAGASAVPAGTDLRLLHHMLGISDDRYPDKPPYRNHFVAAEGHATMAGLRRLESCGLVEQSFTPGWANSCNRRWQNPCP